MHYELLFTNSSSDLLQSLKGRVRLQTPDRKTVGIEPFEATALGVKPQEKKVFLFDKDGANFTSALIPDQAGSSYSIWFDYDEVRFEPNIVLKTAKSYRDIPES